MSARMRLIYAAALAASLLGVTGCATRYPEELPWKDGWREAVLSDVFARSDPTARAARDCRKDPAAQGFTRFARATYTVSRNFRRSIIVPLTDDSLRASDLVYVNVKRCGLAAVARASAR